MLRKDRQVLMSSLPMTSVVRWPSKPERLDERHGVLGAGLLEVLNSSTTMSWPSASLADRAERMASLIFLVVHASGRSCGGADRTRYRRQPTEGRGWCPDGHGRCPSGATASCRRREPWPRVRVLAGALARQDALLRASRRWCMTGTFGSMPNTEAESSASPVFM